MFRESPTGGTSITFVQSVPLSGPLFGKLLIYTFAKYTELMELHTLRFYVSHTDFVIDGVLKKRRLISDEGEVHPLIINFQVRNCLKHSKSRLRLL